MFFFSNCKTRDELVWNRNLLCIIFFSLVGVIVKFLYVTRSEHSPFGVVVVSCLYENKEEMGTNRKKRNA